MNQVALEALKRAAQEASDDEVDAQRQFRNVSKMLGEARSKVDAAQVLRLELVGAINEFDAEWRPKWNEARFGSRELVLQSREPFTEVD